MIESPKRNLVTHMAIEISLLTGIALITLLLLNIRIHRRQIERAHSQVIYSARCDKSLALRLTDQIEARGLFDGVPHLFYLDRTDAAFELSILVAPEAIYSVELKQQLADLFYGICQSTFEQHPVDVGITDEDFEHTHMLIEYRPDGHLTDTE